MQGIQFCNNQYRAFATKNPDNGAPNPIRPVLSALSKNSHLRPVQIIPRMPRAADNFLRQHLVEQKNNFRMENSSIPSNASGPTAPVSTMRDSVPPQKSSSTCVRVLSTRAIVCISNEFIIQYRKKLPDAGPREIALPVCDDAKDAAQCAQSETEPIMAMGIASNNGQGVAITKTARNRIGSRRNVESLLPS